ncbi:MAG: pilus assembly protein PilP [Nitrospirae bacterium]|nr:pilus assembly protein PilP [Nitrospirota bacterium]
MIQNQKNIEQNSERRKDLFLIVCLILASLFFLGACDKKTAPSKSAAAKTAQEAAPQSAEAKETKAADEVITYDKKGKRDPFVSLIVTAAEKPRKGQAPLENYDISAIKILGIVWNDKGHFAEVVLPDGKAYTLREGMTIGLHEGKVQRIDKNHIVIMEKIKDYKGQLKSKETILKLREGEEK